MADVATRTDPEASDFQARPPSRPYTTGSQNPRGLTPRTSPRSVLGSQGRALGLMPGANPDDAGGYTTPRAESARGSLRDQVAFMLFRAPDASLPSPELKELDRNRKDVEMISTMRSTYQWWPRTETSIRTEQDFRRKRDKMTDYVQIQRLQSHVLRK
mmetsp:Transcript_65357/g.156258  ORF Transcript_65357/g.156258 Transcript_65357/m.156258 type:complete len:158 (-) Transcript_65357:92-565(-)